MEGDDVTQLSNTDVGADINVEALRVARENIDRQMAHDGDVRVWHVEFRTSGS